MRRLLLWRGGKVPEPLREFRILSRSLSSLSMKHCLRSTPARSERCSDRGVSSTAKLRLQNNGRRTVPPHRFYMNLLAAEVKEREKNPSDFKQKDGKLEIDDFRLRLIGDNLIRYGNRLTGSEMCKVLNSYAKIQYLDHSLLHRLSGEISANLISTLTFTQLTIILSCFAKLGYKNAELVNQILYMILCHMRNPSFLEVSESGSFEPSKVQAVGRTLCLLLSACSNLSTSRLTIFEKHTFANGQGPDESVSGRSSNSLHAYLTHDEEQLFKENTSKLIVDVVPHLNSVDICVSIGCFSHLSWWHPNTIQAYAGTLLSTPGVSKNVETLNLGTPSIGFQRNQLSSFSFELISLLTHGLSKIWLTTPRSTLLYRQDTLQSLQDIWKGVHAQAFQIFNAYLQHLSSNPNVAGEKSSSLPVDNLKAVDNPLSSPAMTLTEKQLVGQSFPSISAKRLCNFLHNLSKGSDIFLILDNASSNKPNSLERRNFLSTRKLFKIASEILKDLAVRHPPQFNPQTVANTVSAYSRVQLNDQSLLLAFVPLFLGLVPRMEPQHVCMTAAAFAAANLRHGDLLHRFCTNLAHRIREVGVRNLEQDRTLRPFAHLFDERSDGNKLVASNCNEPLLWQAVSGTFLSMCKLDFLDPKFAVSFCRSISSLDIKAMELQTAANLAFAITYLVYMGQHVSFRKPVYVSGRVGLPEKLKVILEALEQRLERTAAPLLNNESSDEEAGEGLSAALKTQVHLAGLMRLSCMLETAWEKEEITNLEAIRQSTFFRCTRLRGDSEMEVKSSMLHKEVCDWFDAEKWTFVSEKNVFPYYIDIVLPSRRGVI